MNSRSTTFRDLALAALAAAIVVWSMTAMLVTVRGADRSAFVLVVEVATWVAATVAIAAMPWRRTRWGRLGRGHDRGRPTGADDHGRTDRDAPGRRDQ
jgi:hypothetical protein